MNKVYLVCEEYGFDGETSTETSVCGTKEKARELFNSIVEREKTKSWVRDAYDSDYFDLQDEDEYFYCYDELNFDETAVYIVEKEIL